ncbi:MAG: hypothetical protein ACYC1D_13740 [Acidimicrobiales bacterium]
MTEGAPSPERDRWEVTVAMVRRPPPAGCAVVGGSTPVVAFGDPIRAEVATLGINPSGREFLGPGGALLGGDARRLATLASLAASSTEALSDAQVRQVVDDCAAYFDRNPYWTWFEPLDALLKAATDTGYRHRSACHLDLVQWATDPVWGQIPDVAIRERLLADGVAHLSGQLAQSNVRLVLINGATVAAQVAATGMGDLEPAGHLVETSASGRKHRWTLFAGAGQGVTFLGWSRNLQSPSRAGPAFRDDLAGWIRSQWTPPAELPATGQAGRPGTIARGSTVDSKAALAELLGRWHSESDAATIGEVGRYGGTPWLRIDLRGGLAVLNADTKRAAVDAFLEEVARHGAERPWSIIANHRGRLNKVTFDPDGAAVPGWYCYVATPAGPGASL